MGQVAARAAACGPSGRPSGGAGPLTAAEDAALARLAARPPLRCVFHHEDRSQAARLPLPLVFDPPPPDASGMRLVELEAQLRATFGVPESSSVFAVVPADELYSPPFPLALINVVALRLFEALAPGQEPPELHLALVVRSLELVRRPLPGGREHESPFFAVPARALALQDDSVARRLARARFASNMRRYGFARLEVTPEQAKIPVEAFAAVRKWLAEQMALPKSKRWVDYVDASGRAEGAEPDNKYPIVSRGRRVGFSSDRNREYLQLRMPMAASGTVWPPRYFADNDEDATKFASDMLTLLQLLDDLARDCMRAICESLCLDESWIIDDLLDARTPPPSSEEQVSSKDVSYKYGASVLRIYNYRNKAGASSDDNSCGVHADLGLVTVSPVATVPGLQMWNLERMIWTDVEQDAESIHFSVFAGETLGLLTNGLISAPLHRVPGIVVDSEESRRMSMPYFLRVRPEVCLNPRAPKEKQILCRDFMEDVIFKKRPWRREDKKGGPPDY